MPIKKDIRDLPRATLDGGWAPDEDPWLATALVDWWIKQEGIGSDEKEVAVSGRKWRASWASMRCDRQLFYAFSNTAKSEPPTIADEYRFWVGKVMHDYFQHAVWDIFGPEWEVLVELKVDLAPLEIDGSLHGDIVLKHRTEGTVIAVELKSINGMGFKDTACLFRGKPPRGPRVDHILQGAVLAESQGADRLIIVYLSLELVGPELAAWTGTSDAGRFCAQWTLRPGEWKRLVDLERMRLHGFTVAQQWADEAGKPVALPPRRMHDPELRPGSVVIEPWPKKGKAVVAVPDPAFPGGVDVDTITETWRCGYCSWRTRCVKDGA